MKEEKEGEMEWVLVKKPAEKDLWSPSFTKEEEEETEPPPLKIQFNEPAKHWTDAVPIGNGRLGAMVWGNIVSETLNLNEDTLWTGAPGNYTNLDAPAALSDVRKLVDDGKYAQATDSAVKLSGNTSEVYQLLGDMILKFDDSHSQYIKESYIRELDLNTAKVKVTYSVLEVEYTREHFVSNPDQTIVTKISATKSKSVSFTVSLDSKMLNPTSNSIGNNRILLKGSCPGSRYEPDNTNGIHFSAVLDLEISDGFGSISIVEDENNNNKMVRVEGSDWAVIRLTASSSFEGPFTKPSDSKKDPTLESIRMLDSIKELSYAEVYARHLDDYQNLFHRVSLQIWKSVDKDIQPVTNYSSTSDRVKSFGVDEDPSLVQLLFQFGRYLLISCSRRGTQVSNLQGIWNKDIQPPWDGAQHLNINLQMNYWPSLSCNLEECQEPLFDYISCLSVNGSKTAKVNYETDGWVAHQVTDLWAKTSPDKGLALWAMWPMGGAWLCTHLWEHYSFTMDKDFLKQKAYPLIKGCTLFLLDWLIEGRDGSNYLETNPSTSPEHLFTAPDGNPASVSYSSTMDMAIIKEVFSIVVSAAKILGKSNEDDGDLVGRVLKAQLKLPPTRIARDGSIMEWALDFEDPDVHHRHVSHLFGLFPGHTITPGKNPDLCKAAENTLYKRGEEGPGWSTTWKAALWARLRNSEHAYRMIKRLFILVDPENEAAYEGGLYSNLFTAHPPFQIDANFGFPAAVAEMLVQSTLYDLYLLPALPREKWANGYVKGLKARGGVTVNIRWNEGNIHQVGIWSRDCINATRRIHYRENTVTATLIPGRVYTFNTQLKCVENYSMLKSDCF